MLPTSLLGWTYVFPLITPRLWKSGSLSIIQGRSFPSCVPSGRCVFGGQAHGHVLLCAHAIFFTEEVVGVLRSWWPSLPSSLGRSDSWRLWKAPHVMLGSEFENVLLMQRVWRPRRPDEVTLAWVGACPTQGTVLRGPRPRVCALRVSPREGRPAPLLWWGRGGP